MLSVLPPIFLILFAPGFLIGCKSQELPKVEEHSTPVPQSAGDQTSRDTVSFLRHLADKHATQSWKDGPTRLDSPELRQAYPGFRFYFVSSPQPMPPGARPSASKSSRLEPGANPKPMLTLCVRFGPADQLDELRKTEDFNRGLMAIGTEDEARVAAAAILSTMDAFYLGPERFASSLIQVQKSATGWMCRLKTNLKEGKVGFDAGGKCITATLRYSGPFPG